MSWQLPKVAAWAACLLGTYCPTGSVFAAASRDDRVSVLEEKLDRSLKLIDQLTARVQELEAQRADSAATARPVQTATEAEPSPQTLQRLEGVEQQLTQMADADAARRGDDTGLPVHGFADIGAGNHNAMDPALQGFAVGGVDFYLNPMLGEHVRALFELNFEVVADGGIAGEMERAQIGYQFSDAATVWIGRFHTPFGYYNTAFHHGQQIATSLRRPRFLLFEDQGGVMPNHTVGAWLTGAQRLRDGKLTYDLFVGNGQAISDGAINPQSGGVDPDGNIFGGNFGYVFSETLNELKIGVSAFRTRISDDQQAGRITRVDNAGVYFAYDTDRFEHIGEFYRFNNRDLSSGGAEYRSTAGFIQLAWRLPIAMPYARYERALLDQADNYFALQLAGMSYRRAALGLRVDLDPQSALKLELARSKNTDRLVEQWTDALLQYAIRF